MVHSRRRRDCNLSFVLPQVAKYLGLALLKTAVKIDRACTVSAIRYSPSEFKKTSAQDKANPQKNMQSFHPVLPSKQLSLSFPHNLSQCTNRVHLIPAVRFLKELGHNKCYAMLMSESNSLQI